MGGKLNTVYNCNFCNAKKIAIKYSNTVIILWKLQVRVAITTVFFYRV